MHKDHRYIEALRTHDTTVLNEIYAQFATPVKRFLLSKGATEDEAGDLFQDALIDVYKTASAGTFILTCPFEAFILMICKRKWINLLKKKNRQGVTKSLDEGYTQMEDDDSSTANILADEVEREQLLIRMLEMISERCREIILASLNEQPQEKIAAALGVSYGFYRKKKSNCMASLIELMNKHTQP